MHMLLIHIFMDMHLCNLVVSDMKKNKVMSDILNTTSEISKLLKF